MWTLSFRWASTPLTSRRHTCVLVMHRSCSRVAYSLQRTHQYTMSLYYEKSFCAEYQIVVAAVDVVIVWFQSGYTFIIRADD